MAACRISRLMKLLLTKFNAFDTFGAPYLFTSSFRDFGSKNIFSILQIFTAKLGCVFDSIKQLYIQKKPLIHAELGALVRISKN